MSRQATKRMMDVALAILLLVLLAPLFAAIYVVVRADGGTALFPHRRIGRHGVPFDCLKFRTMRPNSDTVLENLLERDQKASFEWLSRRKLLDDPRVTSIGAFLRSSSLDELPQLLNVIKGDMSLVGPRPVIAAELPLYGSLADVYLSVRPGLTGLWQVSGRSALTFDRRAMLDCQYVLGWSLSADLVILIRTIPVVLSRLGAC